MATFWERAAHSVNRVFSFYYVISVISRLSFESSALVLIEPVPGHFLPFAFLITAILARRPVTTRLSIRILKCMADFSDQFKKVLIRYKRIDYNLNFCDSLHA